MEKEDIITTTDHNSWVKKSSYKSFNTAQQVLDKKKNFDEESSAPCVCRSECTQTPCCECRKGSCD